MKRIYIIVGTLFLFSIIVGTQFKYDSENSISTNKKINTDEFKEYIKEKPYTILYFWASWCGFSQAGLINDYSKNYHHINNDTVQSLLIVASDTNSINSFMQSNDIHLPYKCLYEGKYSVVTRNTKDGSNMVSFINNMFGYKIKILGFPTVLLVDSSFTSLMESDKTTDAVRIYRYFERQKLSKNKKSP